jgi:putative transposase
LKYKALKYDRTLVVADRWYPSSKLCSFCHWKNADLKLNIGIGNVKHAAFCDRDVNAALNLRRLATETALPVASHPVTNVTKIGMVPILGGKVTPVRYEGGLERHLGQEENCAHINAHF